MDRSLLRSNCRVLHTMDMYKSSILVHGYQLLIAGGHGEWPTLKLCADSSAIMVK